MGEELWNIDGPDDALDKVVERLSLLKAQLEVQISLQATAKLLRRVPSDKALPKLFQSSSKALPKQQATKVKHLVRFTFRKNSRQELLEQGEEGKESRHRKLHKLDCDAAEFICHSNLSYLLYRPDVDKAVDSKLEDPEDDESFDKFMQCTQCGFLK